MTATGRAPLPPPDLSIRTRPLPRLGRLDADDRLRWLCHRPLGATHEKSPVTLPGRGSDSITGLYPSLSLEPTAMFQTFPRFTNQGDTTSV
jgi:hypothetical protein